MKKSIKQKIVKPEAIFDCVIIEETSKILLNFFQILKKEKLINDSNFLYGQFAFKVQHYSIIKYQNHYFYFFSYLLQFAS